MNSHIPQKTTSGETLPLFAIPQVDGARVEGSGVKSSRVTSSQIKSSPIESRRINAGGVGQSPVRRTRLARELPATDHHMHVAWQLSRALKAAKTGRKSAREFGLGANKLNARQRHKVGNAICEHLLASLRQQVVSEQSIPLPIQ
jgi:hypothetical protein